MHGNEGHGVGFWGRCSVEMPRDQRHSQQQYLNAFCLPLHREAVKRWVSLAFLSSLFLLQKIPAQLCPCLQLICIISTCCLLTILPFYVHVSMFLALIQLSLHTQSRPFTVPKEYRQTWGTGSPFLKGLKVSTGHMSSVQNQICVKLAQH